MRRIGIRFAATILATAVSLAVLTWAITLVELKSHQSVLVIAVPPVAVSATR
ncbi:MAG TPA: hypothetical protein VMG60_03265 [Burkholderiaceae bacterium]|nr:hypothetical protein [Burkholderiaceae bacterium]